jgi:hypothetical protein
MSVKKNVSSILTTAMENADKLADPTQIVTDTADEMIAALDKSTARKQLLKKAAIATLAGAALVYIAARLSTSSDSDEETETDTDAQD